MSSATIIPFRSGNQPAPLTQERVERALMEVAWLVTRHGEVYAPLFNLLEQELSTMRQNRSPTERARQLLQTNSIDTMRLQSAA